MLDIHTDIDLVFNSKMDEFTSVTRWTQDTTEIDRQNQFEREFGNNGFWNKRGCRKIASIPVVAYHMAKAEGVNVDDDKELLGWLSRNKRFMTVNHVLTPGRDARTIIK
jgi:hypothetical protein